MDYEKILRKYIEARLDSAKTNKENKPMCYNLRAMAFGALMFAQEAGLIPYDILHDMWEGENGYHAQFPVR